MDVEDAFSRLPETHAAALRLRARGFDHDAIAAMLGLEPTAVAPLLQIAQAKLEALTARNAETDAYLEETGLRSRSGSLARCLKRPKATK